MSFSKSDSTVIDSAMKNGIRAISFGVDSVDYYINALNQIAYKKGITFAKGEAYRLKSRYYHMVRELKLADLYIDSAITIHLELDAFNELVTAYYTKGIIAIEAGDMFVATQFLMTVIQTCEEYSGNYFEYISALAKIELGKIFYYQGNYQESIELAKKALIFYEQAKADKYKGLMNAHTLIGNCLRELNNPECIQSFDKALEYAILSNDSNSIAVSKTNLGSYYLSKENFDLAGAYLFQSYEYFNLHSLEHFLGPANINIGQYYFRLKKFNLAKKFNLIGLEFSKRFEQYNYSIIGYGNLAIIYEKFNQKDSSIFALNKVIEFTNLQKDESLIKEREKLLVQYGFRLKELENERLSADNKLKEASIVQQKKNNFQLTIAIAILLLLSTLIFLLYKRARKISSELEKKNIELHDLNVKKNEILSIISHDLRAPISQIYSLHKEQISSDFTPEETEFIQNSIGQSVENGLQMLENILLWAKGYLRGENTLSAINLSALVSKVTNQVGLQAETKQINLINAVGPCTANIAEELAEVIIRNIISNAIKFTNPGGEVQVYIETKEQEVFLYIADNGIGMTPEMMQKINRGTFNNVKSNTGTLGEKGSGIGLQLCQDLAKRMDAALYVERSTNEGTVFVLKMIAA